MKRILTALTAILLTAAMLAGCGEQIEMTRGAIKDNVYTNGLAELAFTAPEGWTYYTDEEIAEMLGTGADMIGESRATLSNKSFKKINKYDMFVTEPETGAGVAVMYQNLAAAEDGVYLYEVTYFDLLKERFSKAALNCEFSNYTEDKIGSNTFLVMSVTYSDYSLTQYYYIRRAGNYMICILVNIPKDDDIDSVMANFS